MRKIRCRNINKILDFWPRWRCRQTHCASSHNQKDNNKFKNNKQPELTENWTVWKSNNQGVKEETFIQICRRSRARKPGREDSEGSGWRTRAAPHMCADKLGGTTGDLSGPHNPGFQHEGIKPQTSDWKHLWGLKRQWEKLPASQESSLERPTGS